MIGPFEAWLLLRGTRSLFLRVPAAARNARRVAECLATYPGVVDVLYPGLSDHPGIPLPHGRWLAALAGCFRFGHRVARQLREVLSLR